MINENVKIILINLLLICQIIYYSGVNGAYISLSITNASSTNNVLIGVNQLHFIEWADLQSIYVKVACQKNQEFDGTIYMTINGETVGMQNSNAISLKIDLSKYDSNPENDRFTIFCGLYEDSTQTQSIDLLKLYTDNKPRIRQQNTLISAFEMYNLNETVLCEAVSDARNKRFDNLQFFIKDKYDKYTNLNIQSNQLQITPTKVIYSIHINGQIGQTYSCCTTWFFSRLYCVSASFYDNFHTIGPPFIINTTKSVYYSNHIIYDGSSGPNNEGHNAGLIYGLMFGISLCAIISVILTVIYCTRRRERILLQNRSRTQRQQNNYVSISTILTNYPSAPPRESMELSNAPPPSYNSLFKQDETNNK